MIHEYNNANQTRWDHGDFKVQLRAHGRDRPIGFCDGTAEDLAELQTIAEQEGATDFPIAKKMLKSGREMWTLGAPGGAGDGDE